MIPRPLPAPGPLPRYPKVRKSTGGTTPNKGIRPFLAKFTIDWGERVLPSECDGGGGVGVPILSVAPIKPPSDYVERIDPDLCAPLRLAQHVERYRFAARYAQGRAVLDAACGTGYGSAMLVEAGAARVVGLDRDSGTIGQNRVRYRDKMSVQFEVGDVCALPFAPASFEMYVCLETLEHVRDGSTCIEQAYRVLAPGGILILSTPNADVTSTTRDGAAHPVNPYHIREYRYSELIELLGPGFRIEDVDGQCVLPRSFGPWLLALAARSAGAPRPATKSQSAGWLHNLTAVPRHIPPSRYDAWLQPLYWLLVARRLPDG